jgi:hypothetical protein
LAPPKTKKREGERPGRILLYVDQIEELYTRSPEAEARRFSEMLAEGLDERQFSAFGSLRADYFDRLQADRALLKYYEHINVAPLDPVQLSDVVTTPAMALGVHFEDERTAERITTAAAAEPGALPLLSYLLTDMWDGMVNRGDATLRLASKAIDIGGFWQAVPRSSFEVIQTEKGHFADYSSSSSPRLHTGASRYAARPGARNAPRRSGHLPAASPNIRGASW